MKCSLIKGDCLDILPSIPDGSIDCIIDDLPYGVVNRGAGAGRWDNVIPIDAMWKEFLRVAKEDAAIIFFAQGMFSARLMLSRPDLYKYTLIWAKNSPTGFLNANRMPLRMHEDILVFYRKLPTFNPQMRQCSKGEVVHSRGKLQNPVTNNIYGKRVEMPSKVMTEKYPTSILYFHKPHYKGQHPTEKPVDLCRWLIRSYTNEGDTVLDATMGYGTTGVAAALEHRWFVGIEKDESYFSIASRRIEDAIGRSKQGELL